MHSIGSDKINKDNFEINAFPQLKPSQPATTLYHSYYRWVALMNLRTIKKRGDHKYVYMILAHCRKEYKHLRASVSSQREACCIGSMFNVQFWIVIMPD